MSRTFETTVRLVEERVYVSADKQGERPTVIEVTAETNTDADAFASLPDEAWGWFLQRRMSGSVEVDGHDRELTSLPFDRQPMVWVDATELDIETIAQQVIDQEEYRQECAKARLPLGPLPHGRDQRPTLLALSKGDRVLLTRSGEKRFLSAGDRLVTSAEFNP